VVADGVDAAGETAQVVGDTGEKRTHVLEATGMPGPTPGAQKPPACEGFWRWKG
jgi:hypothetical protein